MTEPASVEMPSASTLALHSEAMAHKPDLLAVAYRKIEVMQECVEALGKLRLTARILLQNAEGCAVNHYGLDYQIHGAPGWLADCEASIKDAESALAKLEKGNG